MALMLLIIASGQLVLSDPDLIKALMTAVKASLRAACLTLIHNGEGKLAQTV